MHGIYLCLEYYPIKILHVRAVLKTFLILIETR